MGEVAEMMMDGTLCQVCGVFIDDEPPGYPVTCGACKFENRMIRQTTPKIACPTCGKKVKEAGLADHTRDVHGKSLPVEGNAE